MGNLLTTKKFNLAVNEYYKGGDIPIQRDCNAVAIMNVGDTVAFLNGIPVFPSTAPATIRGDVFQFAGEELEAFEGNLTLKFQAPVGAAPKVVIIQQFYTANYKTF